MLLLEPQLAGDVADLGPLRLVEIGVAGGIVGTGVLSLGVEEKIVDAPVDVVVVRHVLA